MIHLDGYLHNHLGNKPLVFYLSYFSYCKYLFTSNLREKEFIQINNSIEGGEDMAAGEEGMTAGEEVMTIEARVWLVKLHLHSRSSNLTGNGVRLKGSSKAPPPKDSTTFRKKATGLETRRSNRWAWGGHFTFKHNSVSLRMLPRGLSRGRKPHDECEKPQFMTWSSWLSTEWQAKALHMCVFCSEWNCSVRQSLLSDCASNVMGNLTVLLPAMGSLLQ